MNEYSFVLEHKVTGRKKRNVVVNASTMLQAEDYIEEHYEDYWKVSVTKKYS